MTRLLVGYKFERDQLRLWEVYAKRDGIIRQDRLIVFVPFERETEGLNASDSRIFLRRGAPLFYFNNNKPHNLQNTSFIK